MEHWWRGSWGDWFRMPESSRVSRHRQGTRSRLANRKAARVAMVKSRAFMARYRLAMMARGNTDGK